MVFSVCLLILSGLEMVFFHLKTVIIEKFTTQTGTQVFSEIQFMYRAGVDLKQMNSTIILQ